MNFTRICFYKSDDALVNTMFTSPFNPMLVIGFHMIASATAKECTLNTLEVTTVLRSIT